MKIQIIGFLLLLAVAAYFQIRSLLAKGLQKEVIVCGGLWGLAAIIGSLLIAGVDVPKPTVPLQIVFEPIGKALAGK
ncbi:hypothetical protein [Effusibacillus pohliae]|uniref:hypothetical protein n=1 Tax=Effusibacillus pohliae TaxID=232270 RepID=UPI0003807CE9|nr:hypothetical protein [Effusibacillus pohliae]